MNTAEIIERCRELPGVTVSTGGGYAELMLSNADGKGRMRFIPVFPGITLAGISVGAPVWPAPGAESCSPEAKGPLIINYCTRGRCELVLNDGRHVFLTAGQISLTERFAQREYVYPGRVYEGIEIFIDPETAESGAEVMMDGFGLDVGALRGEYCPGGETFIARLALPDALTARLSAAIDGADSVARVGMKTGVIELLAMLLYEKPAHTAEPQVFYTKSQVEIAKQTERIITSDLAKQHTVREFAALFSVSESSIKNYFTGVFGQSISQYTTRQRMLYAAKLLAETRLSVIEVACRAGYANQSKFAAAFRREFGCAPLEYRRKNRLNG